MPSRSTNDRPFARRPHRLWSDATRRRRDDRQCDRRSAPPHRAWRQSHRHRSFYAGGEVNRRIRQALAPYPDDLVIVSKVGAAHTTTGPIPLTAAQKPAELRAAVEADLEQLGIDRIPVVNLRRLDL